MDSRARSSRHHTGVQNSESALVFTLTDQQKFGPAKTLPKFPAGVLLSAERRRKKKVIG
jgi:hypothetical protein